jgi:hypothetical protein
MNNRYSMEDCLEDAKNRCLDVCGSFILKGIRTTTLPLHTQHSEGVIKVLAEILHHERLHNTTPGPTPVHGVSVYKPGTDVKLRSGLMVTITDIRISGQEDEKPLILYNIFWQAGTELKTMWIEDYLLAEDQSPDKAFIGFHKQE